MPIGLNWDRPAFHGDSFTVGLYASVAANCYRLKLIADMVAAGHGGAPQLIGATGAKMTSADTVTNAQAEVAAHNPDFVLLAYGINDAWVGGPDAATFEAATDAVLDAYAGRQILVAGIAWCGVHTGDPGDPVYDRAAAFEAILSAQAAAHSAAYSPLLALIYNHWEYLSNPRIASAYAPAYAGD